MKYLQSLTNLWPIINIERRRPTTARRMFAWFFALAACWAVSGCAGYQIGARSLYRPDIQTVYVPVFVSDAFRRNVGELLTEAVVKEIELKTPYKVVSSQNADSVLTGRITSIRKRVVGENINDDPRELELSWQVQINWTDRRGQTITQYQTPFSPLALEVGQTATFVPEAGQSFATTELESIQRLARQIVGRMELSSL